MHCLQKRRAKTLCKRNNKRTFHSSLPTGSNVTRRKRIKCLRRVLPGANPLSTISPPGNKVHFSQDGQQCHAVGLLSRASPCSFLSSLRRIQSDISSYDSIMIAMFGTCVQTSRHTPQCEIDKTGGRAGLFCCVPMSAAIVVKNETEDADHRLNPKGATPSLGEKPVADTNQSNPEQQTANQCVAKGRLASRTVPLKKAIIVVHTSSL